MLMTLIFIDQIKATFFGGGGGVGKEVEENPSWCYMYYN